MITKDNNNYATQSYRSLFILFATLFFNTLALQVHGACTTPPSGLVGWWRGEGNANDFTSNNNGSLTNGASYATGEVGQGFFLGNSNACAIIPASATLNVGTNAGFTIETWVKPLDIVNQQPLVEWNNGVNAIGTHFWLSVSSSGPGSIYANIADVGGIAHVIASSSGLLVSNVFQHVAITYDKASGRAVIYLNGSTVASQSLGSFTPQTAYSLYLGRRPVGGPNITFTNGIMDEVSLYNRALSSNEIQSIHASGSLGKCANPTAPSIISQPTNQTVVVGQSTSFNVSVSGTPPFNYQWLFNQTNVLNGATNASLTLSSIQFTNAGLYSVTVSNQTDGVISSNATLTVNSAPPCVTPPDGLVSWWRGEGDATDALGVNNGILSNTVNFAAGEVAQAFNFNGTNASILVPASASLDVGQSNGLTLEAWINPTDVINQRPILEWNNGGYGVYLWTSVPVSYGGGPGSLCANIQGPDGYHTVYTAGGRVVSNVWQHAAVSYEKTTGLVTLYLNGVIVNRQNVGSFTPQTSYPLHIGRRPGAGVDAVTWAGSLDEIAIYNRALTSNEVLSVYNASVSGKCSGPTAPSITSHPAGQTVIIGQNATFSVSASGTQPFTYQWFFNDTNILSGATNASLTLTNLQLADAGLYSVAVSNQVDGVISSNALLTVNQTPPCQTPPTNLVSWWRGEGDASDFLGNNNGVLANGASFTTGKAGQGFLFASSNASVFIPASSTLNVGAGTGFSIETWICPTNVSNQQPLVEWNNGNGYGTHFWISVSSPGAGCVYANVEDTGGASHVIASATGLVVPNVLQHVAVTYDKTSGYASLYLNGVSVASQYLGSFTPQTSYNLYLGRRISGGPNINFLGGVMDEVSLYSRALSSNEIQSIYVSGALGKCANAVAPVVTSQPANQTVVAGQSASFSVSASGTQPFSYQWLFNNTQILNGATNATLSLTNVQLTNAGLYSVTISNQADGVISSNAILTVNPVPSCVAPPSGLVSWWRGEGDATDALGANNGILSNTVDFAAGEVGQAFGFNGTNASILVPASASLDIGKGNGFTLEAWINPADVINQRPILEWNNGGYGVYLWTSVPVSYGGGPGSLCANIQGPYGYNTIYTASGKVVTNLWQHAALSYDKTTGVATLYLNGVIVKRQNVGSFTPQTSYPLHIGRRPGNGVDAVTWAGRLDEIAIYNRALTSNEILSVYNASVSGKCSEAIAPYITSQPADQTVPVGHSATFAVSALGTQPFIYQWLFNNTNVIAGATNASLILTNIQTGNAGLYSVTVSNQVDGVVSSNATLTVNLPPANVRIVSTNGIAGGTVTVPVLLVANGNENALTFSLNFDTSRLSYNNITVGGDASGALLFPNFANIGSGKIGVTLGLAANTTFAQGTWDVVDVTFNLLFNTNYTVSPITFGDVPTPRKLSDTGAHPLSATYTNGSVTIVAGSYEADVMPRPGGDKTVDVFDWVQIGRFIAGLDTITNAAEFQKVDCAPRDTLGDGQLKITDWVQAGRYAAALDPWTPAGGPTSPVAPMPMTMTKTGANIASVRQLVVNHIDAIAGLGARVTVDLIAQGNENAVGFTLTFDPANFSFTGYTPGTGVSGALLQCNTNGASNGIIGVALALPVNGHFNAGTSQLIQIGLKPIPHITGDFPVAFADAPVPRSISDTLAIELSASYVNNNITVLSPPALIITPSGTNLILTWPASMTGFNLQSAVDAAATWSNGPAGVTNGANLQVILPASNQSHYFRLFHP